MGAEQKSTTPLSRYRWLILLLATIAVDFITIQTVVPRTSDGFSGAVFVWEFLPLAWLGVVWFLSRNLREKLVFYFALVTSVFWIWALIEEYFKRR